MNQVHGVANLKDGILTIKTPAKRGKKVVENVQVYTVSDADPDPKIAYPVIALTKADGTVYHAGYNEYGYFCDCGNGIIREKYGARTPCKHCVSLIAVGLLPKETVYPGANHDDAVS